MNDKAKQDKKQVKPQLPKCEYCGAEFVPTGPKQKFCSNNHKQAAWQEKQRQAARE